MIIKAFSYFFPGRRLLPVINLILLLLPAAAACGAQVRLSWDADSQAAVAGYKLYYGRASRIYDHSLDAGNNAGYLLTDLEDGRTYYFAVTAYGANGIESNYSEEVSWTAPPPNLVPTAESASFTTAADTVLSGTLSGADADGDDLTFTIVNEGSLGAVVLTDGLPGSFIYTPLANSPAPGPQLHYVDSEEVVAENGAAVYAFDGDNSTFWHTQWQNGAPLPPHEIQIDLGRPYDLTGFRYLPRQDGSENGRIGQYEFYVSDTGFDWGEPVAKGTFVNDKLAKEVAFGATIGRFIRLRALAEVNAKPWTSVAELSVVGKPTGQRTDIVTFTVNDGRADSNPAPVLVTFRPSAAPFSDDFSLDTISAYKVANTWTWGGTGRLQHEAATRRLKVLSGDNVGLKFSRSLPLLAAGTFSMDFHPIKKYPSAGSLSLRLIQDQNNYYELFKSDGYGPGMFVKYVGGRLVDEQYLQYEYKQGRGYKITINFGADQTTMTGFGEVAALNKEPSPIMVSSFEVVTTQQDAYYDNILFTDNPAAQPPLAADDVADTLAATPVVIDVLANDGDSDGAIAPNTLAILTGPSHGTFRSNGDGTIEYSPAGGFTGADSFTYTVQDNEGLTSNEATVAVLVGAAVEVVNQPPVAVILAGTVDEFEPSVSFDAGNSTDPDGIITDYSWNFGDGEVGTGPLVNHVFSVSGTYVVTLTVTDDEGAAAQAKKSISVRVAGNEPPAAAIIANILDQAVPLVNFDGGESGDADGLIVEYLWDFGDGETGRGVSADHAFPVAGEYTVSLTVKDDEGAGAQSSVNISVADESRLPGDIAVNFQPVEAPLPEGYLADSGGSFATEAGYGWTRINDFKVEDRNNENSPAQEYDTLIHIASEAVWEMAVQDGKYAVTVCMGDPTYPTGLQSVQVEGAALIDSEPLNESYPWIVRNATVDVADGRLTLTFKGTTKRFVRLCWIKVRKVNDYPDAKINVIGPEAARPLAVDFDASGSSGFDLQTMTCFWDFGDGETGSGIWVEHNFPAPGTFAVSLVARDGQNRYALAVKKIMIGLND